MTLVTIQKSDCSWVAETERRSPMLAIAAVVTPGKAQHDQLARETALKCLAGPALYDAVELLLDGRWCACPLFVADCPECVGREALRQAREGVSA